MAFGMREWAAMTADRRSATTAVTRPRRQIRRSPRQPLTARSNRRRIRVSRRSGSEPPLSVSVMYACCAIPLPHCLLCTPSPPVTQHHRG
ncbi:hypothetical protein STENM327S_09497 [Streptomyces tendae]